MVILLRQASFNGNQHLLTLELSDWMEHTVGIFPVVVELMPGW